MIFSRHIKRKKFSFFKKKYAVITFVLFVIFFISFIIYFARDLPSPGQINQDTKYSTVYYDRDGNVLFESYKDKNRIPVRYKNIPKNLVFATVAIEDKEFFRHKGFSIFGYVRAVMSGFIHRRLEGGSTLTQQLVKNVLLTQERTLPRKIKEFILSLEIERRYSKEQILEMYLNEAPYGGQYWGVASAAKGYFGKSIDSLSLEESAFIAGLPQRPSYYSPFIGDDKAYIGRTNSVLRRMREDKYITSKQEKEAIEKVKKMSFKSPHLSIEAPHFVFYVQDLIEEKFGSSLLSKGIRVKTSISLDVQKETEKIVQEEIQKTIPLDATNGSAVVIDVKTGEILSMVGSYDYNNEKYGRYNTAIALRQPGSAVKPFTYATAFTKGYTPSTIIMDVKTEFPDQGGKTYIPVNYDGKYKGPIQMRFALGNSINIAAVKTLAMVGIKPFLQLSSDMGLTTFQPNEANLKRFGLSITLGGGEVKLLDITNAYSTFARGGIRKNPIAILEIQDYNGKILYKADTKEEKKVIDKEIAFLISHILSDNNARSDVFGARSYLNVSGKTVAVKTGTTDDKRDNWTIGYTNDIAVGVWVGNNDNSPMSAKIASGLTGASPVWNRVIKYILKSYKDGIIEKPDNVEAFEIDSWLGGIPHENIPLRSEYFIKGTTPTSISPFYKKIKTSKTTGKLANDIEIKSGDYDEKEYIVFYENDPISNDGKNRWQEGIDAWVSSQPDERLHPPKEESENKSNEVVVVIREPSDLSQIDNNTFTIRAKILSGKNIVKTTLFINGSAYKEYQGDIREITEDLTLSDGVYGIVINSKNNEDKSGQAGIKIGINKDPNPTITPIPTTTIEPSPTL